jgi:hypothetical protein
LLRIGRIGQNFLIAGHGGIEYHLTHGVATSANGKPLKTVPSANTKMAGIVFDTLGSFILTRLTSDSLDVQNGKSFVDSSRSQN